MLTFPIGNLQVINPTLEGARDGNTEVKPLRVPPEYHLAPVALSGPAANVARLYAAFSRGLSEADSATFAPDFAHPNYLLGWLRAIETSGLPVTLRGSRARARRAAQRPHRRLVWTEEPRLQKPEGVASKLTSSARLRIATR